MLCAGILTQVKVSYHLEIIRDKVYVGSVVCVMVWSHRLGGFTLYVVILLRMIRPFGSEKAAERASDLS